MKKKFIFIFILLFIFYILLCPGSAVHASASGLILWYEKVLPALLPFTILSNIMIHSDCLNDLGKLLSPVLKHLLPVSKEGSFVLLSGFLFGFPMGSKNCAELLKAEKISLEEASILFIITNNISPVFINSYILYQQLKMPELFAFTILILYLPPIILGDILLRRIQNKNGSDLALGRQKSVLSHKKTASRSKINFQIVDAGIMNGFETLARIGGYIVLFSILISMVSYLPLPDILKNGLIGILEITNGISNLAGTMLSKKQKYIFAMMFTAFGGICGLAQTSSMIKDTALSMKKYVFYKLILTAISTSAAGILVQFL